MAYSYNDAEERQWAGPSINGLREIKQLLEAYKDWPRPALEQFLEHGYTNMLPALSVECTNLANKTTSEEIKHTLLHLASVALQADEIVILEH
jgi:hypothetical protein